MERSIEEASSRVDDPLWLALIGEKQAVEKITAVLGDRFVPEAADDAQPDSAGCMAGTRTRLLFKLVQWAISDPKRVYWLVGMAGTGKSSIALTLCRMLRNEASVVFGGSFFCSRSSSCIAQKDARRIFPTLSRLLADVSPEFATALAAEIDKDARIAFKPVHEQIGPLLRQPLSALAPSSVPIVFVIDALDELTDERELTELLKLISDFQSDVPVKFILTSRPEMHIRDTQITNPENNTITKLHTIEPAEVQQDIRKYIVGTLAKAAKETNWYTTADVDALVQLSDDLFIFASTALHYILDGDHDDIRSARLHQVTLAVVQSIVVTAQLDAVYEMVVTGAFNSVSFDAEEQKQLKLILACILTSRSLLTVQALADLLKIRPDIVRSSLRRLHAIVHVPEDDYVPGLRTIHLSLDDYLFTRAPDRIRIPRSLGHGTLAHAFLNIIGSELHFNVSRSSSSYEPNPRTRPVNITPSLEYACIHWAHHIGIVEPSDEADSNLLSFDAVIDRKFCPNLLFWLEVLSVLQAVGRAAGLLRIAMSTVRDPALLQFLRDAHTFVLSSRESIERSAPHIYVSALPFADKTSLVHQRFAPHYTGMITVDTFGFSKHGVSTVMRLVGHSNSVRSVAYSPDGRLLTSGSEDGTVRIWDGQSGEESLSPMYSGNGAVLSVEFASNSKWVASGTEAGVVCIWNVAPHEENHRRLRGHSAKVNSVAISPDCSRIASASDDHTARLWDPETSEELAVLSGHTDCVNGVVFSPNGEILASTSSDGTIRLWHSTTGQPVLKSIESEVFCSVDFSPDGEMIAGASYGAVKLWRLLTGEQITELEGKVAIRSVRFSPDGRSLAAAHGRGVRVWTLHPDPSNASWVDLSGQRGDVRSATFSPDGRCIASAADDGTIQIYSTDGQTVVQPLAAHVSSVNSVAFSRNGSFIVSGSEDQSVRVWDACTGEEMLPSLHGHIGFVNSVTISPDGRLIASASQDSTIRLWDAQSGAAVGEPMRGHADNINAVRFSPDGCRLASASDDKSVRVWDVQTRQQLLGPLNCHDRAFTVAFSPDQELIAAGDNSGHLHLWRTYTGQLVHESLHASNKSVLSIAFSPDGKRIVTSGSDNAAHTWDINAGKCLLDFHGHRGTVWSVAWSLDGSLIGTGSEDATLRLWNATTGDLLATLHGHTKAVKSVAFINDGEFIVSGSEDTTIRKWDVRAACQLPSESGNSAAAALASAILKDGWLVGSSGELVSWVPAEYRGHLQFSPCTLLIGSSRVSITLDDKGMHDGSNWTRCWRD